MNDIDSDAEADENAVTIRSELIGGMGEECEEVEEDVEGDPTVRRQALFQMNLEQCQSLLRREKEIARANGVGRNRDMDAQMKGYMKVFGRILTMPSVRIPQQQRALVSTSIPVQLAQDFQRAVAKEMRSQQKGIRSAQENVTELKIEDIMDLHFRNNARDDEVCKVVPLEEAMKGPGHVAKKLVEDAKNHPTNRIEFNEEQLLVIALCVWPLEQAWRNQMKRMRTQGATVNTLHKLPNDLGLPRILIIGGGGCGKTTIMQVVVVPILRTFFQAIVLTAPSNRAARGFDPSAKTLHSIAGMKPHDSHRISNLHIKNDWMRKRMDANQTHAGGWIHDEALQTSATLLHATALRTTYAREHHYKLDTSRYAQPEELMGRISFLLLCGDHLQLPPVPKSSGLLAPLSGTSDEHKAGASMFNNIHYLFEMETMKRFTDPMLVAILQKMRTLKGAKLTTEEWQALKNTELDAAQLERDPEAFLQDTAGFIESSYLWAIVSVASYSRALASGRRHKQTLFMCVAADYCEQAPRMNRGGLELYKEMLAVPSVAHTNRLPGVVLFHIGMSVRITAQLLPPWVVQDTTGTVMELELSGRDKTRWKDASKGNQLPPAEFSLDELPVAVYVKVDKCDREFLPPFVCARHKASGFCKECEACRIYEGWVMIEPITRAWTYTDPKTKVAMTVTRSQLPLMPAEACPLYSLQGATCDPGLIAHFEMPRRADDDIKWLIVYVLLSRVRSLANLRSIGVDTKIRKIIEKGPPAMLAENFETLFRQKIINTKEAAKAAKIALGW